MKGTNGRFLWTRWWNFGFNKMWAISWQTEWPLASQGRHCMESVTVITRENNSKSAFHYFKILRKAPHTLELQFPDLRRAFHMIGGSLGTENAKIQTKTRWSNTRLGNNYITSCFIIQKKNEFNETCSMHGRNAYNMSVGHPEWTNNMKTWELLDEEY
jgi:hypothetical protein